MHTLKELQLTTETLLSDQITDREVLAGKMDTAIFAEEYAHGFAGGRDSMRTPESNGSNAQESSHLGPQLLKTEGLRRNSSNMPAAN